MLAEIVIIIIALGAGALTVLAPKTKAPQTTVKLQPTKNNVIEQKQAAVSKNEIEREKSSSQETSSEDKTKNSSAVSEKHQYIYKPTRENICGE